MLLCMTFDVMSLFVCPSLFFLVFLMSQALLTQSRRAISGSGSAKLLLHLKSQLTVSGPPWSIKIG